MLAQGDAITDRAGTARHLEVLAERMGELPAGGLRQIQHAAQQELENESDNLRAELSELYMMLETHQITEEEFTAREATLLDRLTRLEEEDTDADDDPQTDA